MAAPRVSDVLNRLLEIQCCSLANYLGDAHPWTNAGNELLHERIRGIVNDHEHYARRLAEAIDEHDDRLDSDSFSATFASLNDLAVDYLLRRLIPSQLTNIRAIEECVLELGDQGPMARLAHDVLVNERRHLETLKELSAPAESISKQSEMNSSSS